MRTTLYLWALPLLAFSSGVYGAPGETRLLQPVPVPDDYFGLTVGVDGDTAVVGAPLDDLNGVKAGAVYVYSKTDGLWTLEEELTAADGEPGDEFGYRVALDGDTLAVGAWRDDTVNGLRSGSVYVFVRSGQSWTLEAKLTPGDGTANDKFGLAVDVHGDTLVAGAGFDLNDTPRNYLFKRSGSRWSEEVRINGGDRSYRAVAVSDDRFALGTAGWNAVVFQRQGTTWVSEAVLTPSFNDPGFGRGIAIEDDLLVVVSATRAYIYEYSGGAWNPPAELQAPAGQYSHVTAISNGRVLVSNRSNRGPRASLVYERSATGWNEVAALLASDALHHYGYSASISGDEVVIGSWVIGLPGAAHAFTLDAEFSALCDASDGSLALCPCGNPGSPDTGCDIQQGTGGVRLDITGRTFAPQNQATAVGTGYPPTFTPGATLVRSASTHPSGTVVFGDGVFCLANPVVRLGGAVAVGGTTTHVFGHGAMAGAGTFFYQLHYRNTPAMFCTPDAFNLSSGRSITW